jgi:RHS repeat-associated protein
LPHLSHSSNVFTQGLAASGLSGSLPGRFAVSKVGAATYEIPLAVPPGSCGLAPELSLQYSSQSGDGLLGMGWSLSGLSKITRSPANPDQDGYFSGVTYSQDLQQCDRFSLDGLKLVAVTGVYGADLTEYRTDPETFTKIVSYGSDGYGPQYFKAWTKSGQIIEYGGNAASVDPDPATTDASVLDPSSGDGRIKRVIFDYRFPGAVTREGVRVWAVSRISDRTGKYMEISYHQDQFDGNLSSTGAYWPTEIRYTGNDNLGRLPYNKITFDYTPRPPLQAIPVYESGARIQLLNRLSAINTYENGNLVLQYQLQYDADTLNRSRLISVTECDSLGNSLSPTLFTWQDDPNAVQPQIADTGKVLDLNHPTSASLYTPNGLQGFVWDPPIVVQVSMSADGPFGGGGEEVTLMLDRAVYGENVRLPMDVDGDGRGDLVVIYESANSLAVADTLIYNPKSSVFEVAYTASILGPWSMGDDRYLTMDVTGNGKTDIVVIHWDGTNTVAMVYAANSLNGFDYLSTSVLGPFIHGDLNQTIVSFQPANLTGDRKADLIGFTSDGAPWVGIAGYRRTAMAFTSNGTGFDPYPLNMPLQRDTHGNIIGTDPGFLGVFSTEFTKLLTADLTGNGLTDIVFVEPSNGGTKITPLLCTPNASSGPQFTAVTPAGFPTMDFAYPDSPETTLANFYIFPMDVNGDGNDDITIIGKSLAGNSVLYVCISDGRGGFKEFIPTPNAQTIDSIWQTNIQQFYQGDFNGDGRMDLLYLNADAFTPRAELWISKGSDYGANGNKDGAIFVKVSNGSNLMAGNSGGILPNAVYLATDVTGDGKADVVRIDGDAGGVTFDYHLHATADYQISSLTDIVVEQAWIRAFPSQGVIPNMMTSITDGFGLRTDIAYLPATDNRVYQGPTGVPADPKTRHWQAARYLVSSYSTSDGLGGSYDHQYLYAGAKTHSSYGFLGFEQITVTEPQAKLEVVTTYFQPFPTTGLISTINRSIGGTQVYSRTDAVSVTNLGNRSYAQVDARQEVQNELDGTGVRNTAFGFTYDAYANNTEKITDWASGHQVINQWYMNDDVQWLLGLPLSTSVMARVPFQLDLTNQTVRTFDPVSGLLLSESMNWNGGVIYRQRQYSYDPDGNRTTSAISGSDFAARTSAATYDAQGRFPLSSTNPVGHVETRTFEGGFGGITTSTDPNGAATIWTYDGFGRRATETRPDSSVTTWQYLTWSSLAPANATHAIDVQTTGAAGVTTYMDALGRVIRAAADGFGGRTILVDVMYDSLGRLIKQTSPYYSGDAASSTFQYQYDDEGRVVQATGPDLTSVSTTYAGPGTPLATTLHLNAGDGVVVIRTNSKGQAVRTLYNSLGLAIQTQSLDASGTILAYASYEYDSLGHLTNAEGPTGIIIQMQYDAPGRPSALLDPDLGTRTFQYNMADEMIAMTSPAGSATMTYDGLGRLTSRSETEGLASWQYDDVGSSGAINKLSAVSAPGGFGESYQYNGLVQLVQVNTTIGTESFQTGYTYDGNSRVSQIAYPGPALTIQNAYDAAGYLLEVTDAATRGSYWKAVARNAAGTLTKAILGNGVESTFVLDRYDRPRQIVTASTVNNIGPVQNLRYQYDLDSVSRRINATLNVSESFQFDELGRLMETDDNPLGSYYYSYDAAGDLLSKSDTGLYAYSSGSHRVSSVGSAAFTYDANGNTVDCYVTSGLALRSSAWYSYDKPRQITQGDVQMTFTYDQDRRKTTRVVNFSGADAYVVATSFVGNLYEHDDVMGSWSGNTERQYIFADGNVVAVRGGPPLLYLHRDVLGSLDAVTDQAGAVIETDSFDPHGLPRNPNWTAGIPGPGLSELGSYGFTGHKTLALVGLVDMGGRMYDPLLGRFLSPDPYVPNYLNPQNLNRYSYVNNDPVSRTDPTGFQDDTIYWEHPTVEITASKINPDASISKKLAIAYHLQAIREAAHYRSASNSWNPEPVRGWRVDNTPWTVLFPKLGDIAGFAEATESTAKLARGDGTAADLATVIFSIHNPFERLPDLTHAPLEYVAKQFLERYSLGIETGPHEQGSLSAAPPDNTRVVIGGHPLQIDPHAAWGAALRFNRVDDLNSQIKSR